MRRLIGCQLLGLLLAGMAAAAQVDDPSQGTQPSGSPPGDSATPGGDRGTSSGGRGTPTAPVAPDVTVNAQRHEQPLPEMKADELHDCANMSSTTSPTMGVGGFDLMAMAVCSSQFAREKKIVVEACVNPNGDTVPRRVIQACTELLDHNIFERYQRYAVYVDRAHGYIAQGDHRRALDDYAEAVKGSPHNANIFYDRGLYYAAQSDYGAALHDFDAALSLDAKFVLALRQRAKLYQTKGNFSGALADYSEAIRLKPKTAALWSERGYLCLRQHDNDGARKDEDEAIRLDPKLAVAYFYRGAAFGGLGDSGNAVSDLQTAVRLDPSLDRYVTSRGKSASIALPPLAP